MFHTDSSNINTSTTPSLCEAPTEPESKQMVGVPDVRESFSKVELPPARGGSAISYWKYTPPTNGQNPVRTICLFTGGIGGGHKAPMDAIAEQLVAAGDTAVLYVDSMPVHSFSRGLFDHLRYKSSNHKTGARVANGWRRHLSAKQQFSEVARQVEAMVDQHKIDYVLTNHRFLGDALANCLPQQIPLAIALADPGKPHQGWYAPLLNSTRPVGDALIATNDMTAAHARKHGIQEDMIHTLGYPVRAAFERASLRSKEDIRRELKIPEGRKVLMMTAGNARNPGSLVQQIAALLDHPDADSLYIMALCAKNDHLLREIEALGKTDAEQRSKGNRLKALGVLNSNQMAQHMRAADIMAIQPGGGSIGECIALGVLPILWGEKSGIEHSNRRFVAANGLGIVGFKPRSVSSPLVSAEEDAARFGEAVFNALRGLEAPPTPAGLDQNLPANHPLRTQGAAREISNFLRQQTSASGDRRMRVAESGASGNEPDEPSPMKNA